MFFFVNNITHPWEITQISRTQKGKSIVKVRLIPCEGCIVGNSTHLQGPTQAASMCDTLHHEQHTPTRPDTGRRYVWYITSRTAHTYKAPHRPPVCVIHYITNGTHLQGPTQAAGMCDTLHHQWHTPTRPDTGRQYVWHITSLTAHTYKAQHRPPVCVTHYITNGTYLQGPTQAACMCDTLHHEWHTPTRPDTSRRYVWYITSRMAHTYKA